MYVSKILGKQDTVKFIDKNYHSYTLKPDATKAVR